ncbi:MAG: response regulator transcription factor [Bacteroidetes bacterium]|nr:response regulator transcription factor [Bacteroidota bacterium]
MEKKSFAPNMPINIAIAEDNCFSRQAAIERMSKYPQIRIKHIAANGKELISMLHKDCNIDLVLMDIEMPVMNGIEATKEVKKNWNQIKVLMLTMFDDEQNLFDAILAGASGYILKESNAEQIFRAMMDTITGGAVMSPAIALKALNLIKHPQQPTQNTQDFGLSEREIEILNQLKNGLTYEQIASNLFISYHTVRKHIENIYRKLQVTNKVEALQKASGNRLLD